MPQIQRQGTRRNSLDPDFRSQAIEKLTQIREHCERNKFLETETISRLLYLVLRAKLQLEDIGTSEEELRTLMEEQEASGALRNLESAQYHLNQSRVHLTKAKEHSNPDWKYWLIDDLGKAASCISRIRQYLARSHRTPESIGTTEDELLFILQRHSALRRAKTPNDFTL